MSKMTTTNGARKMEEKRINSRPTWVPLLLKMMWWHKIAQRFCKLLAVIRLQCNVSTTRTNVPICLQSAPHWHSTPFIHSIECLLYCENRLQNDIYNRKIQYVCRNTRNAIVYYFHFASSEQWARMCRETSKARPPFAHIFINNAYFLSHLWSHQHNFRNIMMSWCVLNRANNFYTIFLLFFHARLFFFFYSFRSSSGRRHCCCYHGPTQTQMKNY